MRVIQALVADSTEAHQGSFETGDPCRTVQLARPAYLAKTVYGQKWLGVIFDELHAARNLGRLFFACLTAGRLAEFVLGLTATPVTGKINDLWNLARILRLVGTGDDDTLRRFVKDINVAHRQEKKQMRAAGDQDVEAIFRAVASGNSDHETSLTGKEIAKAMLTVRTIFEGRVIYRTRHSKDFNADEHQAIPIHCVEIPLVFDLPDFEMGFLRRCANEMKAKQPNAGSFYLMPEVSTPFVFRPSRTPAS